MSSHAGKTAISEMPANKKETTKYGETFEKWAPMQVKQRFS